MTGDFITPDDLSKEIADEGRWEEFYQKGDRHGNGKNYYMQDYHKNRRIALQKLVKK